MAKKHKATASQRNSRFSGRDTSVGGNERLAPPPAPAKDFTTRDPESRKRIRDYRDVADSDDEFHDNRDEVLLGEAPEAKRRRKWAEQEEFLDVDDEEVLGMDEDEDEDELEEDELADEEDAEGYSEGDDGDDNDADRDEDHMRGWGTSARDLYGADAIETEEQALEEEAEAIRLQKSQLQSMAAEDYGFDDVGWRADGLDDETKESSRAVVTEVLPPLEITDDMGTAERLKLLRVRYPEFDPLRKELLRIKDIHEELTRRSVESVSKKLLYTKLQAVTAYLGALTAYFALMCSPASKDHADVAALPAPKLHDHPVMDVLVQCRELWLRIEALPDDDVEDGLVKDDAQVEEARIEPKSHELGALKTSKIRPVQKSRAERHAEAMEAKAQARLAERLRQTEADLADLDDLVKLPARIHKTSVNGNIAGEDEHPDFGDGAKLTAHEATEKAKRRKSLRFYTSQIAQKANKRNAAGRDAGGDDDVPYRERLRDRQARLNAEAEKRGRKSVTAGMELGGDSDDEDARQAQQIRADAEDDDYYDLIAARTAKKKAERTALADAQRQAKMAGGHVVAREEEAIGPDGKRGITYAIEKNKGLTPHRSKDARNPRVKKRKKYEEKKKKLASMKPVYRGGEGRGGYGGELTGIKTGLVKSTKF